MMTMQAGEGMTTSQSSSHAFKSADFKRLNSLLCVGCCVPSMWTSVQYAGAATAGPSW